MSRDIPALPWTDLCRLWFVGSIFAAAVAASAIYGVVSSITRSWPEPFTTDQEGKS